MTAALPDWKSATQPDQLHSATSTKTIVLPLDHTQQSRAALPIAHRLAHLYGATVHIACVGGTQLEIKDAATRLGLTAEQTRGAVFEECSASPAELVIRLIRELPDGLLVMSTAMGSQTRMNRFGSLTESVLSEKPRRAVLVNLEHDENPWDLRRILLAHDGTPVSNPAVGPAADLAQRTGTEVIALHVAARGEQRPEAPGSIAAPLYVDQSHHEWPAWAEEFMSRVVATGAVSSGAHFKLRVTGGQAGSELAEVARQAQVDLVIMAWHGHWAEHEDCATRVVVRKAGCPVMLVYSGN